MIPTNCDGPEVWVFRRKCRPTSRQAKHWFSWLPKNSLWDKWIGTPFTGFSLVFHLSRKPWDFPEIVSGYVKIAIEHTPFSLLIYLFKMVIFYSYVSLPEGMGKIRNMPFFLMVQLPFSMNIWRKPLSLHVFTPERKGVSLHIFRETNSRRGVHLKHIEELDVLI